MKPSRIIIENRTDKSDYEAACLATAVMRSGLISKGRYGQQYCHLSTASDGTVVSCFRNKASHRIVISPPR